MMSLLKQSQTVIAMNIASLPGRLWMSLAAVVAVAFVVGVFLGFQAMGKGFERTLQGSGADDIAVVTRVGSRSELNSVILRDQANILLSAPGTARLPSGEVEASAELYVIVDGLKRSSNTEVNIPLRGISPEGFGMRRNITLAEGRMFEAGRNEIIVGQGVARQFAGFELGSTVTFGKSRWDVVGVFSMGGSAFESELWADAPVVQTQFRRGSSFQSMRIRLSEAGNIEPLLDFIEDDPRLEFDVLTEADYFAEQSDALSGLVTLGNALAIVMALGAVAGALNTMYQSVASRARDIATLRAIGFGGFSAFIGTVAESVLLSLVGGVIGATTAYMLFDGVSASTLGASFSQVVFEFNFTWPEVAKGLQLALFLGLVGGVLPAWRAATMPVVRAFKG